MASSSDDVALDLAPADTAGVMAVSIKTAARITDLSTATIIKAVNQQHLPAFRVGRAIRILLDDLREWLTEVPHPSEDARWG